MGSGVKFQTKEGRWWEVQHSRSRGLLIEGCYGWEVYTCVQRKTVALESKTC